MNSKKSVCLCSEPCLKCPCQTTDKEKDYSSSKNHHDRIAGAISRYLNRQVAR